MKKFLTIIFVCTLLTFGGCSSGFMGGNVEELLVAPQPNSLQTAAFNAIKAYAGEQAVIVSPKEGAHSGALLYDDGSFTDTASIITFYSDSNTGTDINLAILRAAGDVLTVTHSLRGVGTGVENVDFYRLQEDQGVNLVVNYTGATANEKFLTVYSFKDDTLSSVFVQEHSYFLVADIQGSDANELIFALPTTREGALGLRIISLSDESPLQLYQGSPNSDMLQALSIKPSYYDEDTLLILEGLDVQNRFSADLLRFDESGLTGLLTAEERQIITHDNQLLYSLDIDNDGILEQPGILETELEIPSDYLGVGYYDMAQNTELPKYVGLVNTRFAFFISIPSHRMENISLVEAEDGITAVDNEGELYFNVTVSDFATPPLAEGGEVLPVLQFGNEQIYLTTYGNLSEYEQNFLVEGIKAIY